MSSPYGQQLIKLAGTSRHNMQKASGIYKRKVMVLKKVLKETIFESLALCDEINEVHEEILIRKEERKFLLRKLCQYDPTVEIEVLQAINQNFPQSTASTTLTLTKKGKRRQTTHPSRDRKVSRPRRPATKIRKKIVQLIPLDQSGRPIFPIALGSLTIHSLGEVLYERDEFHSEDAIYPVGFVSTRIYGSIKDPTSKCIYTCKISDIGGIPRFEIAPDNDPSDTIVGGSPDICHSILLQKINDSLSLNVVSTRPRGNDFFGLTHPTILNLIQSSPGTRKCMNYKWSKFEVSKNGDHYVEDPDTCLSFESLQRSISYCKYKMTANVIPQPTESLLEARDGLKDYFASHI